MTPASREARCPNYYAPPEIELVEDQRGYPGLRARNAVRGRKARRARSGSLHRCAARWTNLRIIFNAPVAPARCRPKTRRPHRAERNTTPTTKPTKRLSDGAQTGLRTFDARSPSRSSRGDAARSSRTTRTTPVEDKSADAKTGYKAKYADGKDYVLATYEKTKTQVNEYAVEPTTTYATETYAYVGDKFVETKDYTYETYDSAKTYTYDTTLSLVENAQGHGREDDARDGQPQGGARDGRGGGRGRAELQRRCTASSLFVAYKSR